MSFTVWAESTAVDQPGSENSAGKPCALCGRPFASGQRIYRVTEVDGYVCAAGCRAKS